MFDFLSHSTLGFWIVAFLIITFDSTLLLPPSHFTFSFESRLNVRLRIVERPFLLRNKEPIIALFSYPASQFFISSLDEASCGKRLTQQALLRERRIASSARQLSHLSLLTLGLTILVGPVLSMQYGIDRALLAVAPVFYVSALFGAITLYANRSLFGFTRWNIAILSVELAVCPILIVNVFRRIAIRQARLSTTDLIAGFSKNAVELNRRLEARNEAVECDEH